MSEIKYCKCGEQLVGHEDESSTECRWCVTGWKPSDPSNKAADAGPDPLTDIAPGDPVDSV